MKKDKVRYAVVGLGHIAQVAVLPAFQHAKNCQLAALITGEPRKARALSRKYQAPAHDYDRFEEALAQEEIEAVFIALPNTMHREFTERAARAGVHVLCEKPMATTEKDCRAMSDVCRKNEVRLMIGYRLHFTDAHLRAIELAKRGKLGELRYFHSLFAMQVRAKNIRVCSETGGGTLYDIGIYCLNAARYLFQAEPTEVLAATAAAKGDRRFAEVEEMASAILRFPDDRLATFTCSFGSADMDRLDLVGTKGALHMEPAYEYVGALEWELKSGDKTKKKTFKAGDQFAGELMYFSQCIRDGREPEPSGEEGLADVRIVNAIYESARTGKSVKVTPLRKDQRPGKGQEIKRPPVRKPKTVASKAPHD